MVEGKTCRNCHSFDPINMEAGVCRASGANHTVDFHCEGWSLTLLAQLYNNGEGRTCGQCQHLDHSRPMGDGYICNHYQSGIFLRDQTIANDCDAFTLINTHHRIPDYHRHHNDGNHTVNRSYPEQYNFETVQTMEIVWYWNERLHAPRAKMVSKGTGNPRIRKFPFDEFMCQYDCDNCYRLKEICGDDGIPRGICTWDYKQIYDFNGERYFVSTKIIGCKYQKRIEIPIIPIRTQTDKIILL